MKVNNPFAGFEQFALSTQEVAMVKGGSFVCQFTSSAGNYKPVTTLTNETLYESEPVDVDTALTICSYNSSCAGCYEV
jgi:hypothetical protein